MSGVFEPAVPDSTVLTSLPLAYTNSFARVGGEGFCADILPAVAERVDEEDKLPRQARIPVAIRQETMRTDAIANARRPTRFLWAAICRLLVFAITISFQ
jgi:hypothetical protein